MIREQELSEYYNAIRDILARARDDILFFLESRVKNAKNISDPNQQGIPQIYRSSRIINRVKTLDSVLRKARRDAITGVEAIPECIEDMIGIRISTPNKDQAKILFEWFESIKSDWFCDVSEEPRFVPYTIADRNKYSLQTGYQAYHVTFKFNREFAPLTTNCSWPCEIQIMSQVWEFWADYSRRYFYGTSGEDVTRLLPYNVAISKILDSADDLMIATADLLLTTDRAPELELLEDKKVARPVIPPGIVKPEQVRDWLEDNVTRLINSRTKVPNGLFITKIADELNIYGVSLQQLEKILQDKIVIEKYEELLRQSSIDYLPVYQQILCMILLAQSRSIESVVKRVNSELRLLGQQLQVPS